MGQNYGTSLHSHYKEHKKLMRCSGSASFFSKKNLQTKNGPQRIFQKKIKKTYRRDDYVKSVKKIYTNKKHTHKKNKRLLADDLKKEKIREIDNEKKKNTTIKKIYTQIQNTQKIPY